jgi:hypothetical protein
MAPRWRHIVSNMNKNEREVYRAPGALSSFNPFFRIAMALPKDNKLGARAAFLQKLNRVTGTNL